MNTQQSIFIMLAVSVTMLLSSVRFCLADEVNTALNVANTPVYDVEDDRYSDINDRYAEWDVIDFEGLNSCTLALKAEYIKEQKRG